MRSQNVFAAARPSEALPIPTFFVLILYFLQVDFRQIWCVNLNILRRYRFHSIYHQTDVQIHRHRTKRPRVICYRVICHRVKQHRIKRPRVKQHRVKNATKSKMTYCKTKKGQKVRQRRKLFLERDSTLFNI